jgi:alkylhydroperoxidase family enzyme
VPRLRQVPRSEVTSPIVLRVYDEMFGPERDPVADPGTPTGTPGDWWTVFAAVPDVFEHAVRGFGLYRNPGRSLSPEWMELGQTRAGWLVGSQFVYSQHCKSCRALGMSEEKIAAISSWPVASCFDDAERSVLAYTDALVLEKGRVTDAVFDALRTHLTEEQIIELTYITMMYEMHAVMSRALRTEFDDRDDPVTEVPGPADSLAR